MNDEALYWFRVSALCAVALAVVFYCTGCGAGQDIPQQPTPGLVCGHVAADGTNTTVPCGT